MTLSPGITGDNPPGEGVVLMRNGSWVVPPEKRPIGWQKMGICEPTKIATSVVDGSKWQPLVSELLTLREGQYIDVPLNPAEAPTKFANRIRSILNMRADVMNTFWSVTQLTDPADEESTTIAIRVTRGKEREPGVYTTIMAKQTEEVTVTTKTTQEVQFESRTENASKPERALEEPKQLAAAEATVPALHPILEHAISDYPEKETRELVDVSVKLACFNFDDSNDASWERLQERQYELGEVLRRHREAKKIVEAMIAEWADSWWERKSPHADEPPFDERRDDYGTDLVSSMMPHITRMVATVIEKAEQKAKDKEDSRNAK